MGVLDLLSWNMLCVSIIVLFVFAFIIFLPFSISRRFYHCSLQVYLCVWVWGVVYRDIIYIECASVCVCVYVIVVLCFIHRLFYLFGFHLLCSNFKNSVKMRFFFDLNRPVRIFIVHTMNFIVLADYTGKVQFCIIIVKRCQKLFLR